jgi:hypothetical protein
MDLELLGSLGWREGLMAVIALLLLYIIVLFFRLRRLQHGVPALSPMAAQSAVAAYAAIQEPDSAKVAAVEPDRPGRCRRGEWTTSVGRRVGARRHSRSGQAGIPLERASSRDSRAGDDRCPAARGLPVALRGGRVARRSAGCARGFPAPVWQSTASAQSASPLYNDAMQMAIQGHDATTIAHRCGIARAEADLVVALARNRHEGLLEAEQADGDSTASSTPATGPAPAAAVLGTALAAADQQAALRRQLHWRMGAAGC